MREEPGRLEGIDAFRYFLCFAVALLHSLPSVAGKTTEPWAVVAASFCRGAVPFFFIASGYFLRTPGAWRPKIVTKPLLRLFPVYLFWFAFYVVFDRALFAMPINLGIKALLTGGKAFHLWFIPVLGVVLALIPTLLIFFGRTLTRIAAILISVAGLALGAYHGLLNLPEAGAIRFAMAPVLVLIGNELASHQSRLSTRAAALAVALSFAGIVLEEHLISLVAGMPFTSHDVVLTTYALGTSLFLLARSLEGGTALAWVSRLGHISLGVYAIHLLFVQLLSGATGNATMADALTLALAAGAAGTAASLLFSRIPVLRDVVR